MIIATNAISVSFRIVIEIYSGRDGVSNRFFARFIHCSKRSRLRRLARFPVGLSADNQLGSGEQMEKMFKLDPAPVGKLRKILSPR